MACAGGLALAAATPLYPLIQVSASQGRTFWARATAAQIPQTYDFVLNALLSAPAAVTAAAVVVLLVHSARGRQARDERTGFAPHEAAAIAVALLIPLLGWALGRLVTGVFVPRYTLSVVPAVSIAIAFAVWRLNMRRSAAEILLCAVLLCTVLWDTGRAVWRWAPAPANPIAGRDSLLESLRAAPPTVMSGSLQFVQFWYYLPPALKPRLHYLADPEKAFKWTGSDTIDRGYAALSYWTTLPVERYDAFIAVNPEFRLYESGGGWVARELESGGATIRPTGWDTAGRLSYVVVR